MVKIRVLSYALASLAFASVMFLSCSGDSGTGSLDSDSEAWTPNVTGINILTSVFPSPKEQNPYSVENMNEIFKNFILENSSDIRVSDIPKLEANFLYVRFLPYGKEGEYELKTYDTSLVLFKHPMDYNEIREPVVYIDRTLPDSIVPYFAAVPVGYEFGPTPYEILQELFLTQPLEEDDEDDQEDSHFVRAKKSNRANKEVSDYLKNLGLEPYQLEIAAFPDSELNAEYESGLNKTLNMDNAVALGLFNWRRWRPSGTLKFYDEQKKMNVPLVGIKVAAGYRFYWRTSTTNSQGYFSSPERWTLSVRYEALFERGHFKLQDGHSGLFWWFKSTLTYAKEGTSYKSWDHIFTGNHAKWCVVWTAAYNYWYGNIYGLKRPRRSLWSMDIEVFFRNNNDFINNFSNTGNSKTGFYNYTLGLENIGIQTYDRSHLEIYETTIHEVAHSSHYANLERRSWNTRLGEYDNLHKILKDTYAKGIERYLTVKHYGTWGGGYDRSKGYTGLFEDLEDTNTSKAYCDRVSGITVPMAEKVLFKSYSWNDFKNNLMNDYPDGTLNENGGRVTYTKADMDALFNYWETREGATGCPTPGSNSSSSTPNSSSSSTIAGSLTLIDVRDRKAYRTTIIGTQTWMAENLNYNATGSKCYSNIATYCTTYGRLYDWATAMALPSSCNSTTCSGQVNAKHRGICPSGWHIPSTAEWDKLMRYADGNGGTSGPYDSPKAGRYLKATSGWNNYYNEDNNYSFDNGNGEDKYGFSALPGGNGYPGYFKDMGYNGDWWSASEYDGNGAYRFDLYGGDKAGWEDINGNRKHDKSNLFSIRCIKD